MNSVTGKKKNHHSSKQTETSKYKTTFEIICQAIVGIREIGKGLVSLTRLYGYFNMPPTMQIAVFNSLKK